MRNKLTVFMKGLLAGILTTMIITLSPIVYAQGVEKTISVILNFVNISVNDQVIATADTNITLDNGDQAPYSIIYKDTTYLSVDKLAEALGKEVTWDESTKTISINDKNVTTPGWYLTNILYTPSKYDGQTLTSTTMTGQSGTSNASGVFKDNAFTYTYKSTFDGKNATEAIEGYSMKNLPGYLVPGMKPSITISRVEEHYSSIFKRGQYASNTFYVRAYYFDDKTPGVLASMSNEWGAYGGEDKYTVDGEVNGKVFIDGVQDITVKLQSPHKMIKHNNMDFYEFEINLPEGYKIKYTYQWKE